MNPHTERQLASFLKLESDGRQQHREQLQRIETDIGAVKTGVAVLSQRVDHNTGRLDDLEDTAEATGRHELTQVELKLAEEQAARQESGKFWSRLLAKATIGLVASFLLLVVGWVARGVLP